MPYTLAYDPEADCLMASITGDVDLIEIGEIIQAMAALARKTQCTRLLNDMRAARPRLSVLEIDDVPRLATQAGLPRSMRRALVVSGNLEDYAFYRASSAIRGHNVRIFEDIEAARNWLYDDDAHRS